MKIVEVVAALICKDNKYLICQRNEHKSRALLWEFVGGKVEKGETHEQALVRECKEELDIDVKVLDLYCNIIHHYDDINISLSLYNAKIINGIAKPLEHKSILWVSKEDLDSFSFCKADLPIIEKIKND